MSGPEIRIRHNKGLIEEWKILSNCFHKKGIPLKSIIIASKMRSNQIHNYWIPLPHPWNKRHGWQNNIFDGRWNHNLSVHKFCRRQRFKCQVSTLKLVDRYENPLSATFSQYCDQSTAFYRLFMNFGERYYCFCLSLVGTLLIMVYHI